MDWRKWTFGSGRTAASLFTPATIGTIIVIALVLIAWGFGR